MKYLNEILIEWDNSTVEDTGIIKSSNIKKRLYLTEFLVKLEDYYNIINKILKVKGVDSREYNFLIWLKTPEVLHRYMWQGLKYNHNSINPFEMEYFFDTPVDIFYDWATSTEGGLLDKDSGWQFPPNFSFAIYIDDRNTESHLYKHYKKFEKFLIKNFNSNSLEIEDHPAEIGNDEFYFFIVKMETNNPKGNETIIKKWFNDILEVCELYIKFIQLL